MPKSSSRQRKLMPLRRPNVTSPSSSPIIGDIGPQVVERINPPYPYAVPSKKTKDSGRKSFENKEKPGASKMIARRMIVCTYMHRNEVDEVSKAVGKLGSCEMEAKVSLRTTHVVCGDAKRTINLLKGIALGCWVVGSSWIVESVEAGHWINEEPYEVQLFPGIRQCRAAQEKCNIFNDGNRYYVSPKTCPPYSDLKDLLELCGAEVVNSAKRATLIVTPHQLSQNIHPKVAQVRETWVLDSIQENILQNKMKYLVI